MQLWVENGKKHLYHRIEIELSLRLNHTKDAFFNHQQRHQSWFEVVSLKSCQPLPKLNEVLVCYLNVVNVDIYCKHLSEWAIHVLVVLHVMLEVSFEKIEVLVEEEDVANQTDV